MCWHASPSAFSLPDPCARRSGRACDSVRCTCGVRVRRGYRLGICGELQPMIQIATEDVLLESLGELEWKKNGKGIVVE